MTCVSRVSTNTNCRFRASNPEHDPRYPADQQMMVRFGIFGLYRSLMSHFQVGPIPGHLDHDTIYNSLRSIFQARGPVCFMFLHKVGSCSILFEICINYNMFIFVSMKSSIKYVFFQGAVKDNNTGKPVKFGYVVFAERGVAQKVLKSGSIAFNGGIQIKVSPML